MSRTRVAALLLVVAAGFVPSLACISGETSEPGAGADLGMSQDALSKPDAYNNDNQKHYDVCVRLLGGKARLKYANGTNTGFTLNEADLNYIPVHPPSHCRNGEATLDLLELLPDSLVFHRGGWNYHNYGNIKYGHISLNEIHTFRDPNGPDPMTKYNASAIPALIQKSRVQKKYKNNGKPCEPSAQFKPLKVRVKPIGSNMNYRKPSAPTQYNPYASYGDPYAQSGPDTSLIDPKKPHYAYLLWSWVNVTGGGVVRTLMKDGDTFLRCDVEEIVTHSYSHPDANGNRAKNGFVRAVYGVYDTPGKRLYGWTVLSHKYKTNKEKFHLDNGTAGMAWIDDPVGAAPEDGDDLSDVTPPSCSACMTQNCGAAKATYESSVAAAAVQCTKSASCLANFDKCYQQHPNGASAVQAYSSCMNTHCFTECKNDSYACNAQEVACHNNAECLAIGACVKANCPPDSSLQCWADCAAPHPNGAALWNAFWACDNGLCAQPSINDSEPFWRYLNGNILDHYYTLDRNDSGLAALGYTYEGSEGRMFRYPEPGTIAVFRYWNQTIGDHYYTTVRNDGGLAVFGYAYEGVTGYVFASQQNGTEPLHQYWSETAGDHYYTKQHFPNGFCFGHCYTYEGHLGYVYP